jgi:hypothetical protein
MNDELLNRLRQEGAWEPIGDGTTQWEPSALCIEAANGIEQLQKQTRQLQQQIDHLRKIADSAFNLAGGCITGCRSACMCNCGYEHWLALQHKKN